MTGVLEIDGNPGGAIYLDKGHVTFARASWSPNLVARLRGALQPTAEVRELLLRGDRPDRDLGTILIERSYLTADQLHAILRSIVVDAVMVLTVPLAEEASIAGIRFESAKTHWAESFCRLPVHLVRTEAADRADRMASYDLADTARLEWRDLVQAGSMKAGRSRRQASVVTDDILPRRAATGLGPVPGPSAEVPAVMPSRQPGATIAGRRADSGAHAAGEDPRRSGDNPLTTLPAESLKRVLDGLRRLS